MGKVVGWFAYQTAAHSLRRGSAAALQDFTPPDVQARTTGQDRFQRSRPQSSFLRRLCTDHVTSVLAWPSNNINGIGAMRMPGHGVTTEASGLPVEPDALRPAVLPSSRVSTFSPFSHLSIACMPIDPLES